MAYSADGCSRECRVISGRPDLRSRAAVRRSHSDGYLPRGDGRSDGPAGGRVVLWRRLRARGRRPTHVRYRDRYIPDRGGGSTCDGGGDLSGCGATSGDRGRGHGATGGHPRSFDCRALARPISGRLGGLLRGPGRAFAAPSRPQNGRRAGGSSNLRGSHEGAGGGVRRSSGGGPRPSGGCAPEGTRDRCAGGWSEGGFGRRLRDGPALPVPAARSRAPRALRRGR